MGCDVDMLFPSRLLLLLIGWFWTPDQYYLLKMRIEQKIESCREERWKHVAENFFFFFVFLSASKRVVGET